MPAFIKVTSLKVCQIIEKMADVIWKDHYTSIIGIEQVEYMLDKFQTAEAIKAQVDDGIEYYLINHEEVGVGYLSFAKKKDTLFLSKIYVMREMRGKKIGKAAMKFIESKAIEFGYATISLTVNKNNLNSIEAYEKMNFQKKDEIVIDIGNGFVMDDFLMEKRLVNVNLTPV